MKTTLLGVKPVTFTVATLALICCANAVLARITIPIYDEPALNAACDAALSRGRSDLQRLEAIPLAQVSVANTLNAWNAMQMRIEDVLGPASLLANVSPDEKVRKAGDDCLLKFTTFNTEIFQSEKLYRRMKAVKATTLHQKQLRTDLLEEFEDTGVALPAGQRARVKTILDRLEALRQEFAKNVREDRTRVAFTPQDMQGLPQAYLDKANKDPEGNYLLGFDAPEFMPFMTNADREDARRRYYIAYTNRGGANNIGIMKEVMELRREMAKFYGLPSYADFVLRRRMAENPANVTTFLSEVRAAIVEAEKRELAEMRDVKAAALGTKPDATTISQWDKFYFPEKIRKARFAIDQEAIRKYFPMPATLDWAMLVASKLYGIKFQRVDVPVWHPDVQYYDVLDTKTGKFLSGIYLDLYPRDGKYKHAAAFGVRSVSRLANRTPVSVLVTNFNRHGLDQDEVNTLFHEYGHVLHGVLSQTDYQQHGGTSVKRDFVEAPSQMFEEWMRKSETLKLMRDVCPECPAMDQSLVDRLEQARVFDRGTFFSRQHLYADFDMAMTSATPGDPVTVWNTMEAARPLGHVDGTEFPRSFSHIVGGYAAGYYGYMWSQVLALDMLSAFGDNIMNPTVGRRFRETILANGGQVPAKDLVRKFLGREPNSKAFYDELAGKRKSSAL